MRVLALAGMLAVTAWILSGCASGPKGEEGGTYHCPSCAETLVWEYHPTKPWIKTGREVVHTCPNCKREWGANLSATSTCTECQKRQLECPLCKTHH